MIVGWGGVVGDGRIRVVGWGFWGEGGVVRGGKIRVVG